MKSAWFGVGNMHGEHCEGVIRGAIRSITKQSIEAGLISSEAGVAQVRFGDATNEKEVLEVVKDAIAAKGYRVKLIHRAVTFAVTGMVCAHCEATIRSALIDLPSVSRVLVVSSGTDEVAVQISDGADFDTALATVQEAISATGYSVDGDFSVSLGRHAGDRTEGRTAAATAASDAKMGQTEESIGAAGALATQAPPLGESDVESGTQQGAPKEFRARFLIDGMHCSNCASTVEAAMRKVTVVKEANVSVMTSEATVLLNVRGNDIDHVMGEILEQVTRSGYSATLLGHHATGDADNDEEEDFDDAISAAELEARATKIFYDSLLNVITSLPLALGSMVVTILIPLIDPSFGNTLKARIAGTFSPSREAVFQLVIGTIVQFVHGWPFYVRTWRSVTVPGARLGMDALIVTGTSAAYIYSVAAMSVAASEGKPSPAVHFEAAAAIIAFVLLGDLLKALAKSRATSALNEILKLQPAKAFVVRSYLGHDSRRGEAEGIQTDNVTVMEVPKEVGDVLGGSARAEVVEQEASAVVVGDILRILPGSRVPADCDVLWGRGAADESMLTGESVPVSKEIGDPLLAGTTAIGSTFFAVTRREGRRSAVAQIAKLVRDAQTTKAPVEDVVDRVAGVFTPIVLVIALVAFIVWLSLAYTLDESFFPEDLTGIGFATLIAVDILVVACPCAMGLATPTAMMAGMGLAANHGLIVKSAAALQSGSTIRAVVFDKTGTLTTGAFSLVAVRPTISKESIAALGTVVQVMRERGWEDDRNQDSETLLRDVLLWISGSAEAASEHPIAAAIVEAARAEAEPREAGIITLPRLAAPDHSEAIAGRGVRASFGHLQVLIGTPDLIEETALGGDGSEGSGEGAAGGEGEGGIGGIGGSVEDSAEGGAMSSKAFIPTSALETLESLRADGATSVIVSVNDVVVGVVAVSDTPRAESAIAVEALEADGVSVWMLTGDAQSVAQVVASRIGIKQGQILAEVRPAKKAEVIQELQKTLQEEAQRERQSWWGWFLWLISLEQFVQRTGVAMVGDGVNDAPALAAADLGLAVGAGTAAAAATAGMVLAKSNPFDVFVALDIARATMFKVLQNLVWAFGYNVLAIPIAAGLLYPGLEFLLPPVAAALLMTASSVSVVVSSILLSSHRVPVAVIKQEHSKRQRVSSTLTESSCECACETCGERCAEGSCCEDCSCGTSQNKT